MEMKWPRMVNLVAVALLGVGLSLVLISLGHAWQIMVVNLLVGATCMVIGVKMGRRKGSSEAVAEGGGQMRTAANTERDDDG